MSWESYYTKMILKPRPTLVRALEYFETNEPTIKTAIDLGCGNGRDTLTLLQNGWRVRAIDAHPKAIESIEKNVPIALKKNLKAECVSFEAVKWRPASLVNASLSLPFCPKESFREVWEQIVDSLETGGVFTGHFFGINDDWQDLMLIDKTDLKWLFEGFKIEFLSEKESDAPSATGPMKHWHIFEVIAVKTI